MKKTAIIMVLILCTAFGCFAEEIVTLKDGSQAVLYDDRSWAPLTENASSPDELLRSYRSLLRIGINATEEQILTACEMYDQGWRFTMPRPKSAKAAWGVSDGRTTWYNGWWYNSRTKLYSATTPEKSSGGLYVGDNQDLSNTWRRGRSPARPDIYMFLLSISGGPR